MPCTPISRADVARARALDQRADGGVGARGHAGWPSRARAGAGRPAGAAPPRPAWRRTARPASGRRLPPPTARPRSSDRRPGSRRASPGPACGAGASPERSSSRRKSASVYSRDDHQVRGQRDQPLEVGLAGNARRRCGTRPTTFEVPCSSAKRSRRPAAPAAGSPPAPRPPPGSATPPAAAPQLLAATVNAAHADARAERTDARAAELAYARPIAIRRPPDAPMLRHAPASIAASAGNRSAKTKPSRSTTSPGRTGTGWREHRARPRRTCGTRRSRRRDRRRPAGRRAARGRTRGPRTTAGSDARVHAGEARAQAARDHLPRQRRRRAAPEREEQLEARRPPSAARGSGGRPPGRGRRTPRLRRRPRAGRVDAPPPWPPRSARWGRETGSARSTAEGRPPAPAPPAAAPHRVHRHAVVRLRSRW